MSDTKKQIRCMNESGLCLCGCGRPAPLARQTDTRLGYVKGKPVWFCKGHRPRTKTRYPERGRMREHRAIVEAVLGKKLPRGAQVHHVNGDKSDNRHSNLVVCQDRAYHALLHQRQRALLEYGNANATRGAA